MIYTYTPDFVYWKQITDHQKIKETIYPKIMDTKDTLPMPWTSCNAQSSLSLSDLNDGILTPQILNKVIWEPFDDFLKEFSSSYSLKLGSPKASKAERWFNIYDEGSYQEVHNHISPSFTFAGNEFHPMYSGIYILHQTGPNKTCFRKTSNTPGTFVGDAYTYDTGNIESIKEGTVIMFPNHLDHYVLPAEGERVTVSFNINSTFG